VLSGIILPGFNRITADHPINLVPQNQGSKYLQTRWLGLATSQSPINSQDQIVVPRIGTPFFTLRAREQRDFELTDFREIAPVISQAFTGTTTPP
jgi:hypothetical protein